MRLLHFLCNRWKPILPPPLTVAPYALTGTAIRLNLRNPSQLGREGMVKPPPRLRGGPGGRDKPTRTQTDKATKSQTRYRPGSARPGVALVGRRRYSALNGCSG